MNGIMNDFSKTLERGFKLSDMYKWAEANNISRMTIKREFDWAIEEGYCIHRLGGWYTFGVMDARSVRDKTQPVHTKYNIDGDCRGNFPPEYDGWTR